MSSINYSDVFELVNFRESNKIHSLSNMEFPVHFVDEDITFDNAKELNDYVRNNIVNIQRICMLDYFNYIATKDYFDQRCKLRDVVYLLKTNNVVSIISNRLQGCPVIRCDTYEHYTEDLASNMNNL